MSRLRTTTMLWAVLALACAALWAAAGGSAWAAAERHPHVGRLPGYPAARGVVPVLGSPSAVAAREQLIEGALAAARSRHQTAERLFGLKASAVPNELGAASCLSALEEEFSFATQDVCYRGGPVVHDPKIHLIFWQGKPGAVGETKVKTFPASYQPLIKRYFEDVAHDSHLETNTFAVQPQYGEVSQQGGKATLVPGEYALRSNVEVLDDADPFPAKCVDNTTFSEGPCVLDADLHGEIEKYAGSSPAGLGEIYVVLTPPGVGGCFEEGECAYQAYCAYHSDFGGDGRTPGQQTLYADLPYLGNVTGCDSGVHPNEPFAPKEDDEGADAAIDTVSHEINETISDPIGSQCEAGASSPSQCEQNAWTDAIGQEIADKCLPPESTILGVYGTPLGEVLPGDAASSFNQAIDGNRYWAQRIWSNEAGLAEGACVQRRIEAAFTISAGPRATVPMSFDGSLSGAPGDPAVYWVWNFGEGEQVGTRSATISHAFATTGSHVVGLTAYDAYGNSQATVGEFAVGAAPPPPGPTTAPPPATTTVLVKEPVAPAHLTVQQLAAKLGLPANNRKLTGLGPYALGRGECPPACALVVQLFAKVPTLLGKQRTSKLVSIGVLRTRYTLHGSGALSLSLSAKGRALLRREKTLACKLLVAVEGQEGASWQISRALTLKR